MASRSAHLGSGQFFGRVAQRREAPGIVLSDVVHRGQRSFPRHVHERTYVSLLLSGTYGEQIGSHAIDHGPLSVSLRPAGVEHRDRVGSEGGRFFMMEIAADWLSRAQGERNSLLGPAAVSTPSALFVMLRLYQEFRRWDKCSSAAAEQLAAALVYAASPSASGGERHRPSWLDGTFDMVNDRFRENLTLAQLAKEAGVHPAYLSYTFSRYYGRTPGELARQLRVQRVCVALTDSRRSLSDLAYDTGFADQAHMTRIVTRLVGMSPGRLRAMLQS